MYNPVQGRFLSMDPQRADGIDLLYESPFVYSKDNPVTWVDPSGRVPSCATCCCCLLSMRIDKEDFKLIPPTRIFPPLPADVFGHQFLVRLNITMLPADTLSTCTLQWREISNLVPRFYPPTCRPYEWCDVTNVQGPVRDKWQRFQQRAAKCEDPDPFFLEDDPVISKSFKWRFLCIEITVKSSCKREQCKSETLYVGQLLTTNDQGEIRQQLIWNAGPRCNDLWDFAGS
jgi:hypothetical protein